MATAKRTKVGRVTPAGKSVRSTDGNNTQIGNLSKRMHGASGTKGYPK